MPDRIYSDNEKAFKKNSEILDVYYKTRWCQKQLAQPDSSGNVAYSKLVWTFNPPESPWFGGFYERLVGTVKRGLFGFKPQRQYCIDELQTLLTLIEALVNSRPLMYNTDAEPAITPAHLVLGHCLLSLPPLPAGLDAAVSPPRSTGDELLVNYAGLLKKLNRFWRIWQDDYLSSLRQYHLEKTREPQVGELVIVETKGTPRGEWPVGIVKERIEGRDGVARQATVWLPKKKVTESKTARLLIPLEAAV